MKKRHIIVLREIQESIPQELLMGLMKKEKQFSTLKQIIEHALTRPDSEVPKSQKRKMKEVLDSGYLEKEVEVVDTSVEEQISQFLSAKIAEAVKQGRLPKNAPVIKHKSLINKGKQYAKRRNARIKALYNQSDNAVVDEAKDGEEVEAEHSARPDNGSVLSEPSGERGSEGQVSPARSESESA